MKKLISTICCLAVCLPLTWHTLFMRYGEMEGNDRMQETESVNDGRNPLAEVWKGEKICFSPEEQEKYGIHYIIFCREWQNGEDEEHPVTIVRIVRK